MELMLFFSRSGKGNTRYIEGLADENLVRIKTLTLLSPEVSLKWREKNCWQYG
jgi:hypothetical protein